MGPLESFSSYHNELGNGFSITDPSTWVDLPGNAVKFTAAALGSGLNSFYNTGVAVGNLFGANWEENDTYAWLSSMDSDVGQYYKENQQAADLVGFVAGSLLPGTAGVKLFNYGLKAAGLVEAGAAGANAAMHTGVRGLLTRNWTAEAIAEYKATGQAFNAWNSKFVGAVAKGLAKETADAAIFEVAATATMFKSPILEDQDVSDLAWNTLTGAAVGGVIGGAFQAAKITKQVKTGIKEIDYVNNQIAYRKMGGEALTPDVKLAYAFNDKSRIGAFATKDVAQSNLKLDSLRQIDIDVRNYIHELISSDKSFANYIADLLITADPEVAKLQMLNTSKVGRVGDELFDYQEYLESIQKVAGTFGKRQTQLESLTSQLAKHEKGEVVLTESQLAKLNTRIGKAQEAFAKTEGRFPVKQRVNPVTGEVEEAVQKLEPMYYDLHTGNSYTARPGSLNMADVVARAKNETVKDALERAIQQQKFSLGQGVRELGADAAELRYQWAEKNFSGKVAKETFEEGAVTWDDLPVLQALSKTDFETLAVDFGDDVLDMSKAELKNHIKNTKDRLAKDMAGSGKLSTDEIARTLDINPQALEGDLGKAKDWMSDSVMFHRDSLRSAGINPDMPRHVVALKDITFASGPMELDALAYMKSEAKLVEMRRFESVKVALGEDWANRYVQITEDDMLRGATRLGGGPGIVSSTLGEHLSLEAKSAYAGSLTASLRKRFRETTEEYMGSYANQLVNDPQVAVKFSAINAETLATTEKYAIGEYNGQVGLVSTKLKKYMEAVAKADDPTMIAKPNYQEGARGFISFGGDQKLEGIICAHITKWDELEAKVGLVKVARGEAVGNYAGMFRPVRPDPKDFQYFAFVRDKTITGAGQVRMVQATSGKELKQLVEGIDRSRFDVVMKADSEAYHKAVKDYEYDETMHEIYFDTGKASKGRTSPFYPMTDPQAIARNLMNVHVRHADYMVRESVKTMYEPVFAELDKLGAQFTKAQTSKFTGFGRFGAEKTVNPYTSYGKMILDVPQEELMPTYLGVTQKLDKAFSEVHDKVRDIFMSKGEQGIDEAYRTMTEAGFNTSYLGAADGLYNLINKQVSKGMLSKYIRAVNVVLGTTMLRSDMFNAINNKLGSVILDSTELNYLVREIGAKTEGKVGALAKMELVTPTGDKIRSPSKLLAEGQAKFFSKDPEIVAFKKELEEQGIISSLGKVNDALINDMTFTGSETDALMSQKIKGMIDKAKVLGEKAEKWTGNKFAEESNRFTTAYAVKQITDEAVSQGVISPQEAWTVIRSHVDRVHGNIIASQRPLLFQGPVGQAFGLFQSYQFNLMQQLFRYVGEGSKKDTLMLLGMQGSMYGMHGLPGFEFMNTHIVGSASGNKEHRDIYDSVYGVAGKEVGDWLLYGAPSNLLGMALYTRGDINPRHPTILPTDPTKLPQWEIPAKALGNLRDTFKMYGDTGDAWASIVRGIERNGFSRPLGGFGAMLQGYTTTGQGNISYAGPTEWGLDMATVTHMARLGGAKPLQESVINDQMYKLDTYAAADLAKRKDLGKNLKSVMTGGKEPSAEALSEAMDKYVEYGGKQKNFARWMGELYRGANEAQANAIANNLKDPKSQRMQIYMGAEDRPDYW